MAERNHATPVLETEAATNGPTQPNTPGQKQAALVVAGIAFAVVTGAVLMQFLSGEQGTAAEQATSATATVKTGTAASNSATPRPTGVPFYLAKVGNEVINYDDVQKETFERYGNEVLEKIVNRKIIEQACQASSVSVSIPEVEQEINKIAQEFNLDRNNWMQMLQAERGLTPLQYKRDVIWPMLALKKLAGTDVNVSDEDVQEVFIRDFGPRVKAKMIMSDNYRRANEIWQQASARPEDFERLAREHSVEPTSRAMDGQIPPIRMYGGQERIEQAAFKLRPKEISGIIELPLAGAAKRYVILKCEGRTEPVVTDLALVKEEIVEQIRKEKVQQGVAEIFQKLQQQTQVVNYMTNSTTGGIQQTSGTAQGSAAVKTAAGAAGSAR
ncbi:peptidylprolyl isomerase [Calycomorphotria hydatis]|uniref:peptidylprolyl isomerase n=1 Tax=Calycomorphotria hydatis TaxID=2528027 RepID=A0A517TD23_9PLAN|nr:peptidylprolyl isomerase [Calycomorphotria hydatis]QDT66275.1 peptidylprolyl isomerase [Calycomorphotria hydatis]